MSCTDRQESFLRRGESEHAGKKPEDALNYFKKAILLCDCNKINRESVKRHGISIADFRLPTCHCKDYLALPNSNEHTSYTLAFAACSCGSGIKQCHNTAHLKALSNIISVHETLKSYKEAQQYASLLITVAPHAPEGYLKMAKVFRLRNPIQNITNTSVCNWLYLQGSRNVRNHGNPDSKLSKALGSLVRKDIVGDVPLEVATMILANLSLANLSCNAMRVSKRWQERCRHKSLWTELSLVRKPYAHRKMRPGVFNDIILERSQGLATRVTIHGLWNFGINHSQFAAMLKALPRLKTLVMSGHGSKAFYPFLHGHLNSSTGFPTFNGYWEALCRHAPSSLTSISLSGFDVDPGPDAVYPSQYLQHDWLAQSNLAGSLENLELSSMVRQDVQLVLVGTLSRNKFLKLETLSISSSPVFPMIGLIQGVPGLKDLYLDLESSALNRTNAAVFLDDMEGNEVVTGTVPWPSLRRLRLRCDRHFIWIWTPLSNQIRSLEFEPRGFDNAAETLGFYRKPSCTVSPPQGLEHFRCIFEQLQPDLRRLQNQNFFLGLRQSIVTGSLRSLDISYIDELRGHLDEAFENHKGVLHTLSCNTLTMHSTITHNGGNWENCVAWMATFPNLKVVGLYLATGHEGVWMAVPGFMEIRPDVKTIYTNTLKGAIRDEVLALAKKKGVTIVEAARVPEPILQFPPPPPWASIRQGD